MQKDERDLLDVLKAELEFLNSGGYARMLGGSWRPVFIFEDSPACMNHDYEVNPASCGDCALMQLVPPEFRTDRFPCRHIPLNAVGETLDSLYRYGDEHEIEETVRKWLQATIARLEEQKRTLLPHDGEQPSLGDGGQKGTALHENAKCANPACPVSFDWRKGGKFFRFREPSNVAAQKNMNRGPAGVHGVRHFWLCERCSSIFTLVYEEQFGVEIKLLRPELCIAEAEKVMTTHNS